MSDIRRYSLGAVILLVVLRLAIGWQLLYEGLWKIDTLESSRPWTSAGYLKNSVGPFRESFRNLAGDPDELGWLDYDTVAGRWNAWQENYTKHYDLSESQQESLRQLMHGTQKKHGKRNVFIEKLEVTPPDGFAKYQKYIWHDAKANRLYVDANQIFTPDMKGKVEALVPREKTEDGKDKELSVASRDFLTAVARVYDRQKKGLGFLVKLRGAVKGDPDLLGNEAWQRVGKLTQYRAQLQEYEQDRAKATTPFEWDHLSDRWAKLQTLRGEVTGPIKAMESDLHDRAAALLTIPQQAEGPVAEPWTPLRIADVMTILGLTALGTMLIVGMFTRFAALAAAFMLFNFYMAMPPLPGVPALAGPEHSFIINKNLVEVFALLVLAALPTGTWFGVDRLLAVFFGGWKADKKVSGSLKSSVSAGNDPETAPA